MIPAQCPSVPLLRSRKPLIWNLKHCRIPQLPIGFPAVQRLETPTAPGPVRAYRRIPIVNLLEQFGTGPPAKLSRHFCPNRKINPGNEQISFTINQPRDIPQTAFRGRGLHVAKKVVGDDDILTPESMDQFRRSGVTQPPRYSLPKPGFHSGLLTFQI